MPALWSPGLPLLRALERETKERRRILCPIAVDATWEDKKEYPWNEVSQKVILDFSKWKTKAFDAKFKLLLEGLDIYYKPKK